MGRRGFGITPSVPRPVRAVEGAQGQTETLPAADQLRYDAWLADQAHRRGLSAALKNDLDQIHRLLPYFDFALDEECFQYHECWKLKPFVTAGKAVFDVEYSLSTSKFCPKAKALNFNSLKKHLALGPWRVACR